MEWTHIKIVLRTLENPAERCTHFVQHGHAAFGANRLLPGDIGCADHADGHASFVLGQPLEEVYQLDERADAATSQFHAAIADELPFSWCVRWGSLGALAMDSSPADRILAA